MNPNQHNTPPNSSGSGGLKNGNEPNLSANMSPVAPRGAQPAYYDNPPTTSADKPPGHHNGWRSVLSTILLLAIAPLIAFGITAYGVQSYQVDGQSMETTLQNNDRLIVDKVPRTLARITGHDYIPHRGNIIIFNQANLPDTSFGESKQLIKRVIGLPGERVVVADGKITIYNSQNPQGFNPDTSGKYRIAAKTTPGEVDVTLQKDQIFVCGDNRPNSEDSRYFGPISANQIVGKLSLRLLPINKAEKF